MAPLYQVVDVNQNPNLKYALLNGQLNTIRCPHCGFAGMLNIPFVYHDPDKEFLFAYLPGELAAQGSEQQRLIGHLINQVMTSLPPEKRKGYLLNPRTFITLSSLTDAILTGEGITPEMRQAQAERARLLNRLLAVKDDPPQLKRQVEQNDHLLDDAFFGYFLAVLQAEAAQGRRESVDALSGLWASLLELSTTGRRIASVERILSELGDHVTREQLLEKIIQAENDAQIEALISAARPLMDYFFFQQLTQRIETASREGRESEAARLKARRDQILNLVAELDREAQEQVNRATALLQALLDSPDPESLARQNMAELDDTFMYVLVRHLKEAELSGQMAAVSRLRQVWEAVVRAIDSTRPPELRLVEELLNAEYPAETQKILTENISLVTPRFLRGLDALVVKMEAQQQDEAARRLRQIRSQAELVAAAR